VAIPKKQLATTLDNYRGISLMSFAAKLHNKIVLRRLVHVINEHLLPWQSGFRPARSTTEQVTALRLIIDRCKARRKDVVVVFVDFAKAFDSVDRGALRQIIRLYGVPCSPTPATPPHLHRCSDFLSSRPAATSPTSAP
jgi:hypothetical protein